MVITELSLPLKASHCCPKSRPIISQQTWGTSTCPVSSSQWLKKWQSKTMVETPGLWTIVRRGIFTEDLLHSMAINKEINNRLSSSSIWLYVLQLNFPQGPVNTDTNTMIKHGISMSTPCRQPDNKKKAYPWITDMFFCMCVFWTLLKNTFCKLSESGLITINKTDMHCKKLISLFVYMTEISAFHLHYLTYYTLPILQIKEKN